MTWGNQDKRLRVEIKVRASLLVRFRIKVCSSNTVNCFNRPTISSKNYHINMHYSQIDREKYLKLIKEKILTFWKFAIIYTLQY